MKNKPKHGHSRLRALGLLIVMSVVEISIDTLTSVIGTKQAAGISTNWPEGGRYKHVSGPLHDWSRVVGELSAVKLRVDIGGA